MNRARDLMLMLDSNKALVLFANNYSVHLYEYLLSREEPNYQMG